MVKTMAKKQQKKQKTTGAKQQAGQQSKGGTAATRKQKQKTSLEFPLEKENFILMGIGFVIIIIGYILMSGDTDIYDFRKTTLSVIVVMFGYAFEVYAILKTPKSRQVSEEDEEQQQS